MGNVEQIRDFPGQVGFTAKRFALQQNAVRQQLLAVEEFLLDSGKVVDESGSIPPQNFVFEDFFLLAEG